MRQIASVVHSTAPEVVIVYLDSDTQEYVCSLFLYIDGAWRQIEHANYRTALKNEAFAAGTQMLAPDVSPTIVQTCPVNRVRKLAEETACHAVHVS